MYLIKSNKDKNELVEIFVNENKDLTAIEIRDNFVSMYYKLDKKFMSSYPIDVMWREIVKKIKTK